MLIPMYASAGSLNINGFELPMILYQDWLLDGDNVKYTRFPVTYDLQFFLSEKGCIDSLKYYPNDKLGFIEGVLASLNNIDFSSGKYLNTEIPAILPAKLEFVYKRYRAKHKPFRDRLKGRRAERIYVKHRGLAYV